jgi:hypothetical protein
MRFIPSEYTDVDGGFTGQYGIYFWSSKVENDWIVDHCCLNLEQAESVCASLNKRYPNLNEFPNEFVCLFAESLCEKFDKGMLPTKPRMFETVLIDVDGDLIDFEHLNVRVIARFDGGELAIGYIVDEPCLTDRVRQGDFIEFVKEPEDYFGVYHDHCADDAAAKLMSNCDESVVVEYQKLCRENGIESVIQVTRGKVTLTERRSGQCPNCSSNNYSCTTNCGEDEWQSYDKDCTCHDCWCEWTEKWTMSPTIIVTRANGEEAR